MKRFSFQKYRDDSAMRLGKEAILAMQLLTILMTTTKSALGQPGLLRLVPGCGRQVERVRRVGENCYYTVWRTGVRELYCRNVFTSVGTARGQGIIRVVVVVHVFTIGPV